MDFNPFLHVESLNLRRVEFIASGGHICERVVKGYYTLELQLCDCVCGYLTSSIVFRVFPIFTKAAKNSGSSFEDCLQFLQAVFR